MWWDHLAQVKHIKDKNVNWKEFKKHFEKKYLTSRYYEKKMKESLNSNWVVRPLMSMKGYF